MTDIYACQFVVVKRSLPSSPFFFFSHESDKPHP